MHVAMKIRPYVKKGNHKFTVSNANMVLLISKILSLIITIFENDFGIEHFTYKIVAS